MMGSLPRSGLRRLLAIFQHQHEAEFPRSERDAEFRTEEIHDYASTLRHCTSDAAVYPMTSKMSATAAEAIGSAPLV